MTAVRESPYATRAYVLRDGRLRVLAEGRFLTAHIAAGGRRVGFVEGGLTRSRLVVAATTTGHRQAIVRVDAYPMVKAAHSTSRGRLTESGLP